MIRHEHSKRKGGKLCATKWCRNKARKNRKICNKCRSRIWRNNNPIRALHITLRYHAKDRGIGFELSFKDFKDFCLETGYHLKVGQDPSSATIDRKESSGPYSKTNIQIATHTFNSNRRSRPLEPTDVPYAPADF